MVSVEREIGGDVFTGPKFTWFRPGYRFEAIFIGGGNTFRLLDRLLREGLIEPIRRGEADVVYGSRFVGADEELSPAQLVAEPE